MDFLLGTHEVSWLARTRRPLFISAVRLERQKTWPKAKGEWGQDSGGFSMIGKFGYWPGTDAEYAANTRRWGGAIGGLRWAAIRDWMCEPFMLAKTGKTIADHQKLTIESLANLRALAPEIAWTPVLQGWHPDDYEAHAAMYRASGFDLSLEPIVGVGSVCRRQATSEGEAVFRRVAQLGLRIHAFGVKTDGLRRYGSLLASADSMAWSYAARVRPVRLPGCKHVTCANCFRWATRWADDLAPCAQTTWC